MSSSPNQTVQWQTQPGAYTHQTSPTVGQTPLRRSALGYLGARWVVMTVVGVLLFTATYFALVRTYIGQYLENAALLGAQRETPQQVTDALSNLDVITVTSLAVLMVVFAVIGFIRRSWTIAFAGWLTLGFASVLAEAFKRVVLKRPNLADIYENNAHNSFPSGHTTIAMAILIALLLVISYRWRGVVMFFALLWAIGIGAATVTARWHRLSDTIGGDMLALTVGALVALWLLHSGAIEMREQKTYVLRVLLVVFVVVTALLMLASGVILAYGSIVRWDVLGQLAAAHSAGTPPNLTAHLDPQFNENLFLSAQALAYAFSAFSALWFWGTLHRLSTRRPADLT